MAETKVVTIDGLTYYHSKVEGLLDQKVDKETGKGLSTEDYTTAEKTKLSGIAEGAQVNVLEGVQVNGSDVAIAGKKVNIDLSAYAIKSEMQTALDGKVDKVEGYGLISDAEKAKIANLAADANATYATKDELSAIPKFEVVPVDALPATGELDKIYLVPNEGSGTNSRDEYIYSNGAWEMLGTTEVDLSGYYTSAQVDEKIAAIEGDVGAVYTKTEIDGFINTINGDVDAVETEVAKKANSADVYTKTEMDSALALKADASAVYTKTEIDGQVSTINTEVAKKANSADVYTKTEVDNKLALKADASSVYTKTEVDSTVSGLNTAIDAKLNSADLVAISNAEIDALF